MILNLQPNSPKHAETLFRRLGSGEQLRELCFSVLMQQHAATAGCAFQGASAAAHVAGGRYAVCGAVTSGPLCPLRPLRRSPP